VKVGRAGLANTFGAAPRLAASYKEALAWLYGTQRFGIKLGLENVRRLFSALDLPTNTPRIIHVAGTNGKGSVCAMIDSILRAQRYRAGLFTSPHLVTFRERIQVNGEMISEKDVAHGLAIIRDLIADWDPHPTFFEIITALALLHFRNQKTEFTILETGMGGRLDATNAVQPIVSVITPIDYDHQKWLGDSLETIAFEKAGIIKGNTPVVSAIQHREAESVIRARAAECNAQLRFVSEPCRYLVGLAGSHQKKNAALAIAALRAGEIAVDDDAVARGLASVSWPARFQRWDERTIIDGAHNPAGAHALAKTWREAFGNERASVILAVLQDKDATRICRALTPIVHRFLLPPHRGERALPREELGQIVSSTTPALPYSLISSIAEAFDLARGQSPLILVTGSLHFAGEALATLRGVPAAYEECMQ
jgi:dihydrofolate synthase/folylpolyglutamate synthase